MKQEEIPFGYGRMSLDRQDFLRQTQVWINRALWVENNRMPMPYRDYNPTSQFTDMLRFDSTGEMSRMAVLARCIAEMDRDLNAKCELLLKMAKEMAQKSEMVPRIHERESGKAWREEGEW